MGMQKSARKNTMKMRTMNLRDYRLPVRCAGGRPSRCPVPSFLVAHPWSPNHLQARRDVCIFPLNPPTLTMIFPFRAHPAPRSAHDHPVRFLVEPARGQSERRPGGGEFRRLMKLWMLIPMMLCRRDHRGRRRASGVLSEMFFWRSRHHLPRGR